MADHLISVAVVALSTLIAAPLRTHLVESTYVIVLCDAFLASRVQSKQ